MNMEKIPLLINKYFQGETSLQEERLISNYFLNENDIPDELAPMQEYFVALDIISKAKPSDDLEQNLMARIDQEKRKTKRNRSFKISVLITSGIAAAFILFIGLQQFNKPTVINNSIDDPIIAMQIVNSAFAEVNKNMEKGMTNFSYLNKSSRATETLSKIQLLNESVEKAAHVHYFNKGYIAFQRVAEIPKTE